MKNLNACLLIASMLIANKVLADNTALEQIKALRQQQADKERERKQASDAAKDEIAELKRQENSLIAEAIKENEEQIKAKKIEYSDEEKQKKAELDALIKEAADLKKALGTPSSAAQNTPTPTNQKR